MAAFIPALIGLGTSLAGGITGLVQRGEAAERLRRAPLAARALGNRLARDIQSQVLAQRTTNPMAAVRTAQQLGERERQNAAFAAASEASRRAEQLAQMERADAQALASMLGNLGSAATTFGSQMIATQTPDSKIADISKAPGMLASGAAPADAALTDVQQQKLDASAPPRLAAPLQQQQLPVEQMQQQQQQQARQATMTGPQVQPRLSVNDLLLLAAQMGRR